MDGRAHRRFIVDREIDCLIGDRKEQVFLYDLSISGCMIEISQGQFHIGDSVMVKLTHFVEARGEVVWQFEQNAGVRFGEPLPDLLVERLGFRPNMARFEDITPRDRFGRLLPSLPRHPNEHRPGI